MSDPCRDWRGALGAAALGEIDPAEEIGLRAHLDGCAACRAELRELTAVARALDAISTPTVVAAAIARNGFTPLTPSQGYFSDGGSRSPSSRSWKRGMKSSFVSVVSMTRPVWP